MSSACLIVNIPSGTNVADYTRTALARREVKKRKVQQYPPTPPPPPCVTLGDKWSTVSVACALLDKHKGDMDAVFAREVMPAIQVYME